MGTYYYLKDSKNEEGTTAVYEDDMIAALHAISKKHGLEITDQMILDQVYGKQQKKTQLTRKNKCIIIIDGSNFYFKLKGLGLHNLLDFDFSGFIKMLSNDEEIVHATYYIGKVSTNPQSEKGKKMLANQQKLFEHLKKHNINYSLGYLLKSDGIYHEKGVDVNIAVD